MATGYYRSLVPDNAWLAFSLTNQGLVTFETRDGGTVYWNLNNEKDGGVMWLKYICDMVVDNKLVKVS